MSRDDFATYLGDSVYVKVESGMVKLYTDNGHHDDPRNVLYLESEVLQSFMEWIDRVKAATDEHESETG